MRELRDEAAPVALKPARWGRAGRIAAVVVASCYLAFSAFGAVSEFATLERAQYDLFDPRGEVVADKDLGAPPWSPGSDWDLANSFYYGYRIQTCGAPRVWTWTRDDSIVVLELRPCDAGPSARTAAYALHQDQTTRPDSAHTLANDADLSGWVEALHTRVWAQSTWSVSLAARSVGGDDSSRTMSADFAQDAAGAMEDAWGAPPVAPAITVGDDPISTAIVAFPIYLWMAVIGPARLVQWIRDPRYASVLGQPHYTDLTRVVRRARQRRTLRTFASWGMWLFGLPVGLVAAGAIFGWSSLTELPLQVFAISGLSGLLYGFVRQRHPVEVQVKIAGTKARARRVAGSAARVVARALVLPAILLYIVGFIAAAAASQIPTAFMEMYTDSLADRARLAMLAWFIMVYMVPYLHLVLPIVTVIIALAIDRIGQRLLTRDLYEARSLDERPPILYLRSFDEDRLTVRSMLLRRGVLASIAISRTRRFEEVIAQRLSAHGPVIAIAQTDSGWLAPLGAARASFGNDKWEDAVKRYAGEALAIVISGTPKCVRRGLSAELKLVNGLIAHDHVIVVRGPWRRQMLGRWQQFSQALEGLEIFAGLRTPWPDGAEVFAHQGGGRWHAWGSRRATDWSYAIALDEAMENILERVDGSHAESGVSTPGSNHLGLGQEEDAAWK